MRRGLRAGALALAGLAAAGAARADLLGHCRPPTAPTAAQQDRQFRFAALVQRTLADSGAEVALVARAGLDLQRFGHRLSHAGVALRDSPNTPWSVRQLYFDCEAGAPRLFDQGLPGFVAGGADPDHGQLDLLLLPEGAARPLARAALSAPLALGLLGSTYSANAHAWHTRYQNCNQWVVELLAAAWGGAGADGPTRAQAQHWLRRQGYQPARVTVVNPLVMVAAALLPYLHTDDHPADDLARQRFDVSLPAAIEAFVLAQQPATRRLQLCHTARHMLLREGGAPLDAACTPAAGDRVVAF